MPREIYPSSYECDCGHQLHFFENTIREMKQISYRREESIGEGGDRHSVFFRNGEMVAIFCPKRNARIPAKPDVAPPPPPRNRTRPAFTRPQGQLLAFIHLYTKLNRRPPAEADIASYFSLAPPSVHQRIVALHRKGLIERQPGVARSIRIAVDPQSLPDLD